MEKKGPVILIVGKTKGKENKKFIDGLNACLPFTENKIPADGAMIIQTETLENAEIIMAGMKIDILILSGDEQILRRADEIGIIISCPRIYTFNNGRIGRVACFFGGKG